MRLATLHNGAPDGRLVAISSDGLRFADAGTVAGTLQQAIEDWGRAEPLLRQLATALDARPEAGEKLAGQHLAAPLPRAWQWLDGSDFKSHGDLMQRLLGVEPKKTERPLMYQGVSSHFYGPNDDVPMPGEEYGIDFEGEFGVITDFVPMGTSAADALAHVKLIVQINDWSLRSLAGPEMQTGFGWIQAKPPCSVAPFAVTPDELGDSWRDARLHLNLAVDWNGKRFGDAHAAAMEYGFARLIEHAALTRNLVAGTIIGSGTVSNENFREIGSSCIAERRGIEVMDHGEAKTAFMKYGDVVRMEAHLPDGRKPFGAIEQKVVAA